MEPQSETLNFANILVLFGDSYLKFFGIGSSTTLVSSA